jgi:hypothetical protein
MLGNDVARDCLDDLGGKDAGMIKKRLSELAAAADKATAGHLDAPQHHMKDMPADLQHIRKMTIGRHRVYWEGHHTDCSYRLCYVKTFKKKGTDDEHDQRFQRKLSGAFGASGDKPLIPVQPECGEAEVEATE